jgi:hypothetical protein
MALSRDTLLRVLRLANARADWPSGLISGYNVLT